MVPELREEERERKTETEVALVTVQRSGIGVVPPPTCRMIATSLILLVRQIAAISYLVSKARKAFLFWRKDLIKDAGTTMPPPPTIPL